MFEKKECAGTVRGQDLESRGGNTDGVMLTQAILSSPNRIGS